MYQFNVFSWSHHFSSFIINIIYFIERYIKAQEDLKYIQQWCTMTSFVYECSSSSKQCDFEDNLYLENQDKKEKITIKEIEFKVKKHLMFLN